MLKASHFRTFIRQVRGQSPAPSIDSDSDDGDDIVKPRRRRLTEHLPQELIDIIIDFLYNDRSSLLACSLVCRSWLPESRVHLFHTVYVQTMRSQLPAESVCSLIHKLAWGPRRSQYVGAGKWCSDLGILTPRLGHLRSLSISKLIVTSKNRQGCPFTLLHTEMPTVRRLKIVDCDLMSLPAFAAFLQAFPNLAHLELREVENWSDEGEDVTWQSSWRGPRLESLSCALLNSWPFVDWLVTTPTPKSLRRLAFSILEPSVFRNAHALADLLQCCGEHLQDLIIDSGLKVDNSVTQMPINLTMIHNTSLSSLTIQTFSPQLLFHLLHSIRSPTIRRLNLELWMASDTVENGLVEDESWRTGDDILAHSRFDKLDHVTLVPVSYLLGQTEVDPNALKAVIRRLATAERRGILKYSLQNNNAAR